MRRALPPIVALVAIARVATAQSTEDRARAEALFKEGRQMMAEGKVPAACGKLEKSQELAPGVGTLINLGACWEQAQRPAKAYAMYKQALHVAADSGRSDRTRTAFERAKQLEAKIARIRFPASHRFACADNAASDVEPGLAVVEPGTHACHLELEKRTRWNGSVTVAANEEKTITPEPEKMDASEPRPAPVAAENDRDHGSATRVAGWIGIGIGIVGLGAGAFFAVRATGKDSDASGHCDARGCDDEGVRLGREAKDAGNVATICFVAGGLVTAAGVGLLIFAPSPSAKAGAARVAPWLSANGGGVGASGSF